MKCIGSPPEIRKRVREGKRLISGHTATLGRLETRIGVLRGLAQIISTSCPGQLPNHSLHTHSFPSSSPVCLLLESCSPCFTTREQICLPGARSSHCTQDPRNLCSLSPDRPPVLWNSLLAVLLGPGLPAHLVILNIIRSSTTCRVNNVTLTVPQVHPVGGSPFMW